MKRASRDGVQMTLNVVKSYFLLRTKVILSYRMTALSGFVTQIIFALFKIFIMYAFIASNPTDSPMTLGATITYIWITQIFFFDYSLECELG